VGGPVPSTGPHRGRVASFDAARGLGAVEEDDGTRYGFHATAIADGSRRIDVGVTVVYTVSPGHGGLYEARSLVTEPS
jgi:cold shock CspA family protein